jgi:hypothetical protein
MFVQMPRMFDHAAIHFGGEAQIIDHRDMLGIFAQACAAGMRADRLWCTPC